jgi:hypothetical protein
MNKQKIIYGDFQTSLNLAEQVIELLKTLNIKPDIVIEPTCGTGSFIEAVLNNFTNVKKILGFDINNVYLEFCKKRFPQSIVRLEQNSFFSMDWDKWLPPDLNNILFIGNPPWVTNSVLGALQAENLPPKTNLHNTKGLAAKTGQANFDIAEWMLIKMSELLNGKNGWLAMLCKTSTARKVLRYNWQKDLRVAQAMVYRFDAKRHFSVSVDACLLVMEYRSDILYSNKQAKQYADLDKAEPVSIFGIKNNKLVSNLADYEKLEFLDGVSQYTWRSGIKHDLAKVMELVKVAGGYKNGFAEVWNLEEDYIYPLLKSADLGRQCIQPRKYVIVPQNKIGQSTQAIREKAPVLWRYLSKYQDLFRQRKSIVYKQRFPFAVFGLGSYSFADWKIAISGLYKKIHFNVIGKYEHKPVMLDDTCCFIPCSTQQDALYLQSLLNSELTEKFINSLVFWDAKRPITIELLKRIDLLKLAQQVSSNREPPANLRQEQLVLV